MVFAQSLLSVLALSAAASASLGHNHGHERAQQLAKRATSKASKLPAGWALEAECVRDVKEGRLLPHSNNFDTSLTPALCANFCHDDGHAIAAVQHGNECWCGDELNECDGAGEDLPASQCNEPCRGDSSQACGGEYAAIVYSSSGSLNSTSSGSKTPSTGTGTGEKNSTSTVTVPDSKYKLKKAMNGTKFFDSFDFFNSPDPTNGHVNYLAASAAKSKNLAYVDSKTGQAVVKVDDTTWLADGAYRDSVRISSKDKYSKGLLLFDIAQMPYGCSIWPAVWTVGDNWPNGGEIDILEGVNNGTVNQQTLHTSSTSTCNTNSIDAKAITSSKMNPTCASANGNNAGCGYQQTGDGVYGASLNQNGGVVYALQMEDSGITIWTFPRDKIPADITAGKPNPAGWSTPSASWPSSDGCTTTDVIKEQTIVVDISLCGDWAKDSFTQMGCGGTCFDLIKDPGNYKNAAFKINSIMHYEQ